MPRHPEALGAADRARLRRAVEDARAWGGRARRADEPVDRPDPGTDTPALRTVVARFGLTSFERDVLLLALAIELDEELGAGVALLTGDVRGHLRVRAVLAVLAPWLGEGHDAALGTLLPGGTLVDRALLEVVGSEALVERRVRLPDEVLQRLLGRPGASLLTALPPVPLDALTLLPAVRASLDEVIAWARSEPPAAVAIGVRGRPGSGRDAVAAAIADALGWSALRCRRDVVDARDAAAVVRDATWARAALVTTGWPAAEALDARRAGPRLAILDRFDPRRPGAAEIELGDLGERERAALWHAGVAGSLVDPDRVATRYRFGAGRIVQVAASASARAAIAGRLATDDDLRWAARTSAPSLVERRAERLALHHTADDLVLPHRTLRELELVRAWARRPSTNVEPDRERLACLFWGPPGTGKSMAAQVLARELGCDAWRVDLSQVVNKYIGETEKNLDRVFVDAADAGAMLLFDEADALFGKRTEAKDAHDRYANQETSYLLQRIEQHPGLVILTTNLAANLDNAFVRRLFISAEFPAPEAGERLAIWQRHVRGLTLADDVDLSFLATRFALAGGDIRNAARAAVLFADDAPVDMSHLATATCRELMRTGRLVTPGDFGPWAEAVARWSRR